MTERPKYVGATFAERKAARLSVTPKQVDADADETENKSVTPKVTSTKRKPRQGDAK